MVKANSEVTESTKALTEAQKEYNEAAEEAAKLNDEKGGLQITEQSLSSAGGVSSEQKLVNVRKQLADVTSKSATANTKLDNAQTKLTNAQNTQALAQSKVVSITKTQTEAAKTLTDAVGTMSKAFKDLGDSMGGTAGNIVAIMGEVGSSVSGSIAEWQSLNQMSKGMAQTIAKASVILEAIATALEVIEKLSALFTKESSYEKTYENLVKINQVLSDTVSMYKKLLETEAGASAAETGSEYLANLKSQIANDYTEAENRLKEYKKSFFGLVTSHTEAAKQDARIEKIS